MVANENSGALNVSVLGAAKETYIKQLKIKLTPLIHEGFVSLWEDAVQKEEDQEGYNYLKQFQLFLKDVPNWNQSILEEETKRILGKVDILMELVTAVFISHVKILASVRLGGNNKNIRIKVPSADVFIHTVYTNAAEMFYYNPQIFQTHMERESYEKIRDFIEKSIDETVDSMIPVDSILKEYLSTVFAGHIKAPPTPPPDQFSEEPFSSFISGNDMGLVDNESVESSPDNPAFGSGDDPFSFPTLSNEKNKLDNIESFGNDDLFGSNDTFGGSNDTFGGSNDTFGGSNDTFGGSNDTFGGSNDTFGESKNDDPFSVKDPFGVSGSSNNDDPFSIDSFTNDNSNNDSNDNSNDNSNDDPFSSSNNDSNNNEDPFSSSNNDSNNNEDPFSSGSVNEDPFSSSNNDSNNNSNNDLNNDPFSSSKNEDPFSSSNDPFSSSNDPFSSSNDPFSSNQPDPFENDVKTFNF